jgi:hypothetical protein
MSLLPIAKVRDDMDWQARLRDIARRVERNVPDARAPERFHEEKSEIAGKLRKLAGTFDPAARSSPGRPAKAPGKPVGEQTGILGCYPAGSDELSPTGLPGPSRGHRE